SRRPAGRRRPRPRSGERPPCAARAGPRGAAARRTRSGARGRETVATEERAYARAPAWAETEVQAYVQAQPKGDVGSIVDVVLKVTLDGVRREGARRTARGGPRVREGVT